jgi:hypothetical protein
VPAKIWEQPYDVERELAEMDLTQDDFEQSGDTAHSAFISCSPNDAPFIPGTYAWGHCLRTFRDVTCIGTRPFRKDDPKNLSLTINDKRQFSIVVASGSRGTGILGMKPTTKSPKGLRAALAIEANSVQGDMLEHLLPENIRMRPITETYATWFYLLHVTTGKIQAELSLPRVIDSKGYIREWFTRILLPTKLIEPEKATIDPESFTPLVEFDVARKG